MEGRVHYLVMLSVKEHASRLKKLTVKLELLVQQDIPRKNNKKNVLSTTHDTGALFQAQVAP